MATVTLSTTKGDIAIEIDPTTAPKAAANFLDLAEKGYYDHVVFHRVVPGFVIQAGDGQYGRVPIDENRVGTGGPGYTFEDEPFPGDYWRGTVAMANAGPNTNGSQFFICLADLSGRLPKNYTIFGQTMKGMDVVDAIAAGPTSSRDRPLEPVEITSTSVER
jgi:cyclophilin family peptidyl-prolyl cis-trans isomerase